MRIVEVYEENGKTLTLREREGHLDLVMGNVPLLTSRALETERTFGMLAKAPIDAGLRTVIVGGLGFGSTLQGVLEVARAETRIIVVEKLAAVVTVGETHARHLLGDSLQDARVTLELADVADVIAREAEGGVGAILLDVDNGPGWASFRSNARLYAPAGLESALRSLGSGGLFAVWSGYEEASFVASLRKAKFLPRVVPLHERGVLAARAYVGEKP